MSDSVEALQNQIGNALQPLVGLRLSIARNAGNMKGFHFGETTRARAGLVGQYALHVQCPWRLECDERIVTGSSDYYVRGNDNADPDWEPGSVTGHLQNEILGKLLDGYDPETRSHVNTTQHCTVLCVTPDQFGGFELRLSGGYRLIVFPAGSRGEYWRLLRPGGDQAHFVVGSGIAELE